MGEHAHVEFPIIYRGLGSNCRAAAVLRHIGDGDEQGTAFNLRIGIQVQPQRLGPKHGQDLRGEQDVRQKAPAARATGIPTGHLRIQANAGRGEKQGIAHAPHVDLANPWADKRLARLARI